MSFPSEDERHLFSFPFPIPRIQQTTTKRNQHTFGQHVEFIMFLAVPFCITVVNSEKHSFRCWRQVSRALVPCLVVSTWTKAPRGWRSKMSRWREMQQHMRQLVPMVLMALSYYSYSVVTAFWCATFVFNTQQTQVQGKQQVQVFMWFLQSFNTTYLISEGWPHNPTDSHGTIGRYEKDFNEAQWDWVVDATGYKQSDWSTVWVWKGCAFR